MTDNKHKNNLQLRNNKGGSGQRTKTPESNNQIVGYVIVEIIHAAEDIAITVLNLKYQDS